MKISRWMTLVALALASTLAACGGDDGPSLITDENNENNANSANSSNSANSLKGEGATCLGNDECDSGVCRLGTCTGFSCVDGVMNGEESDVDCGAVGCPLCLIGKGCQEDFDCTSGICDDGTCQDKNCSDGEKNGLETDVDCGSLCGPCDDGKGCAEISDCTSGVCNNDDVCAAPACDDRVKNGTETDVDCGGPCDPCADGLACSAPADCASGVCTGGSCVVPTCSDSVANGQETGPDCGGPDCMPCGDGLPCDGRSDCISEVCDEFTDTCASPACDDGQLNGTETDRDCGGDSCLPCVPGKACLDNDDCSQGVCDNLTKKCLQPTCSDNVANGNETDVDCGGGRCGSCDDGESCAANSDCTSVVCDPTAMTCSQSQCNDGTENGTETDVDCGGTCNKCADTLSCTTAADCISGVCNGSCRAPTCRDGVLNGNETDVDCGGPDCNECVDGRVCLSGADCVSGVCGRGGTCSVPNCNDGVANGIETDIDCGGGTCPVCDLGQICDDDVDCGSNICDGGPNLGPICSECDEGDVTTVMFPCGFKGRGQVEQTCRNGQWVNTGCANVWFASCAEILANNPNEQDGMYDLDPDGTANEYQEFTVFCDMTTSGGGWTEIIPCTADRFLQGELVAVQQATTERISSCKPETRDKEGKHSYHYTFDFPATFTHFILHNYEARANADTMQSHTSDLGHVMLKWNAGNGGDQVYRGDIGFGSANQAGPVTSYSPYYGFYSSGDEVIGWRGPKTPIPINGSSTKFRIGWGESGPEFEGWYPWWSGAIRLR